MKTLIINLDSETERIAFQYKQLNKYGIEYQRISADDASNKNTYEKLSDKWERPLSFAEVSCLLSHQVAWEIIIENDQPMLVLEDDAFISDDLPIILGELKEIDYIDYVNIEVTGRNRKKTLSNKPSKTIREFSLFRLYQGRSGTGGYVLWPNGAKILLNELSNGKISLVDKFINTSYSLKAYQLEPAILIQFDQCHYHDIDSPINAPSSINSTKKKLEYNSSYLKYRIRRLYGQLKIGLNQLRHFHHSNRRSLTICKWFYEK